MKIEFAPKLNSSIVKRSNQEKTSLPFGVQDKSSELFKLPVNFYFNNKIYFKSSSIKKSENIEKYLVRQFSNITSKDLDSSIDIEAAQNPVLTRGKILALIANQTKFANVESIKKIISTIKDGGYHLVVSDDIGVGSAIAYLQTKMPESEIAQTSFVPKDKLAEKVEKYKKKNPAIILGKYSLDYLMDLSEKNPQDFARIVKHTTFIYPKSLISGVSFFNLTTADELVHQCINAPDEKEIINKFKAAAKKVSSDLALDSQLIPKIVEVDNFVHGDLPSVIANMDYSHKFYSTSYKARSAMVKILKEFQKNEDLDLFSSNVSDEFKFFQESFLKNCHLYTPVKINNALKSMHKQIMKEAKGMPVYYYLPAFQKPKSFNYIASSYFLLNNIPRSQVVRDLSQIDTNNSKIVILDDFSGSGDSMVSQIESLESLNIPKDNLIVSAIAITKEAKARLDEIAPKQVFNEVIEQFDLSKCQGFEELSDSDKKTFSDIATKILIGGYNDGQYNFSTFYMTPNNNNNLFLANIAPNFIRASQGIKISFNTFNDTILQASLDNTDEKFLQEILLVYKKVNGELPDNLVRKMIELIPNETSTTIDIIHSYAKNKDSKIPFDIAEYLKFGLHNIKPEDITNINIMDNIFDISEKLQIGIPDKLKDFYCDKVQNKSFTKDAPEILLKFYRRFSEKHKVEPVLDENIMNLISELKANEIKNINVLEDILAIYEKQNIEKVSDEVLKRTNEIVGKVARKGLSLELFSSILALRHCNDFIIPENEIITWLKETFTHQIKTIPDNVMDYYYNNISCYNTEGKTDVN